MRRWKSILCACILIAAVAVICIAPAYSVQPTALRAWDAAVAFLAALSTLVLISVAPPSECVRIIVENDRPHARGSDMFGLTCTLLI